MGSLPSQHSTIGLLTASSEYAMDTVDRFGRSAQLHSQLVCKRIDPLLLDRLIVGQVASRVSDKGRRHSQQLRLDGRQKLARPKVEAWTLPN